MAFMWQKLTASAVAVIAVATAHANIIYDVNRVIGSGSVVGFIETDGTIGTLATSNILNWNLILNDGTASFTLNGPANSEVLISGTALSATINDIVFDFSAVANSFILFQNPSIGSGQNFWCVETSFCSASVSGEAVGLNFFTRQFNPQPLNPIATARSQVPEPASVALLGAGLAGLGFARRRKK